MSLWTDLGEDLLASELAITVLYAPQGRNAVEVPALAGRGDQEASFGQVRARQDVLEIAVRRADLDGPAREDRFEVDGATYQVSADPTVEEPGGWWRIAGYKVAGPA